VVVLIGGCYLQIALLSMSTFEMENMPFPVSAVLLRVGKLFYYAFLVEKDFCFSLRYISISNKYNKMQ